MTAPSVFAFISIGLFVKYFGTTAVQAYFRVHYRRFSRPEDAELWGDGVAEDHPRAELAQRALQNDAENVPLFLALTASLLALGGEPTIVLGYGAAFFVSRVLHTYGYVWPRQPFRNRAFQLGLLATVATIVHAVVCLARI